MTTDTQPKAQTSNSLIHVVLVDDHAAVRAGYRLLLEADPNIEVIAELSNGEQAYQQYESLRPDVLIMDLSMPGMGGMETLRRIVAKNKNSKILVFTMHDNPIFAQQAFDAGARGYITKSSAPHELATAVKILTKGNTYLDKSLAEYFSSEKVLRQKNPFAQLSNREFQILCLCAEGSTVAEIAERLSLSAKTISNYLTQIKEKVQVSSTAQLVRLAIQHNLVSL